MLFMDTCSDLRPVITFLKGILTIIQFAIPILLIIMGTVDLGKAVMSSDDKEKWANKEDVLDKQFSTIERNLSVQVENVSNIIKQFEACKNNIVKYKNKYLESKEKYNEERKKYLPKLEEITKELEKLEKEVDKKLLQRYKQLKQDKIFPVFVAVNNNSCGGCSMEFSSAHMTKLKQDGYLECEHCRRINYNN